MASPPYEINKRGKSLKPQIELLIDEVTKTQQKIQSLQSTLDNLQALMSQEYANFHKALHEEKQKTELLETRIDNQENLYRANMVALQETLKYTEERVNYKMNVLLQDNRDDIAKLQATVNSLSKRKQAIPNDSEDSDQPAASLLNRTTIGVFQILTDFLLWMVSVVSDPMQNVFHFAMVIYMIFVIYHVCGFIMCNVICTPFKLFNVFTIIDDYRAKTSLVTGQTKR